jgi:hypothetical protein
MLQVFVLDKGFARRELFLGALSDLFVLGRGQLALLEGFKLALHLLSGCDFVLAARVHLALEHFGVG